jgi:hypothetical protein
MRSTIPLFAALLCLGSCVNSGAPARVKRVAHLYFSEADASIEGSVNHKAPTPLATLEAGSTVTVLSDTYGKDYWACYVRTSSSQQGWVLCTSLNYQRAGT